MNGDITWAAPRRYQRAQRDGSHQSLPVVYFSTSNFGASAVIRHHTDTHSSHEQFLPGISSQSWPSKSRQSMCSSVGFHSSASLDHQHRRDIPCESCRLSTRTRTASQKMSPSLNFHRSDLKKPEPIIIVLDTRYPDDPGTWLLKAFIISHKTSWLLTLVYNFSW